MWEGITMSKVIMLFVYGCYESKLCLRVIRGVFIRLLLKRKQTERNGD
jgi:hypothetical protein